MAPTVNSLLAPLSEDIEETVNYGVTMIPRRVGSGVSGIPGFGVSSALMALVATALVASAAGANPNRSCASSTQVAKGQTRERRIPPSEERTPGGALNW